MYRFKNIRELWNYLKKNTTKLNEIKENHKKNNIEAIRKYDLIGPADKISNLRKNIYYITHNECQLEHDYRMLREKISDFNQQYWTQQNLNFLESKKKFIECYRIEQKYLKNNQFNFIKAKCDKKLNYSNEPDSVKMNEFYKKFLDDSYSCHYAYNSQWLKYNFSLLLPAIRVYFYRLMKNSKRKNQEY